MSENDFGPEQLKRLLQRLFERSDIRLVIFFGSRAVGRARSKSDLDLAILGDEILDLVELTNEVMQLVHFSDIDLVDLARCSPTLAMVVARSGKVLYERDRGSFGSFCSLALRRYEDARKLREAQKQAIHVFLRQRGLDVAD